MGTVQNGDRVEVLEKQRRFFRVRTDKGQEGWIEERSLVPQEVYDGFQKLAKDNAGIPVQAHGTTRAELNMHLTPARDGEHLYQLKEGEKLEILQARHGDKNAPKAAPSPPPGACRSQARRSRRSQPDHMRRRNRAIAQARDAAAGRPPMRRQPNEPRPPSRQPIMEDWYLVRDLVGRVGWVLLRMIDLDVPLDVAQYAEGQRIIGYFVLNTVEETGRRTSRCRNTSSC